MMDGEGGHVFRVCQGNSGPRSTDGMGNATSFGITKVYSQ